MYFEFLIIRSRCYHHYAHLDLDLQSHDHGMITYSGQALMISLSLSSSPQVNVDREKI